MAAGAGAPSRPDRAAGAVLGVVLVIAAVVLLRAERGTTFFFDDWNFVVQRFDWSPSALLVPHNEHLSVVPVVIYKLLLSVFGLGHYEVFRVVHLGFNLTCGVLLFLYCRTRIGPWLAAGLAGALVLMGPAFWDILWPFQIGYLGSLAAGLGCLLALDRGTRRGDIAACALVAFALGCSSLGLPILVGVAAELALARTLRTRGWIAAIPAVLYFAWYLKYGVSAFELSRVPDAVPRLWSGLAAGASAIAGTPDEYGPILGALLLAAVFFHITRPGRPSPRLVGVALMPLTFWAAAAVARSGLPASEPRYLYPAGLWVAVVAAEAAGPWVPRGKALGVAVAVLALGVVANASRIDDQQGRLQRAGATTRAYVTAAEVYGPELLAPQTAPDAAQPQLLSGRYFTAVQKYGGSVGYSQSELRTASAGTRKAVDEALLHVLPPTPETVESKPGGATDCRNSPGGGELFFDVPPEGVWLKAGDAEIELNIRRFGDIRLSAPPVTAGTQALMIRRPDRSKQRWELQARSIQPFEACAAG